jgi:hypothetical protein
MGRERSVAGLSSSNTVNFNFPYGGAQHGLLIVRAAKQDLTAVTFSIERGQFACNATIDTCHVNVRFDNGPIRKFRVAGPSDHRTTQVFIEDIWSFIPALRKAKTVRIEATFYREGQQTFEFPAGGFEW